MRFGAAAEHRSKDWRFAHDKKEASIEDYEWEDRSRRSSPLDVLTGGGGELGDFAGAIATAMHIFR